MSNITYDIPIPGHNLPEEDLIIGTHGHACSACCNDCHDCHERPFQGQNSHLNFHYSIDCSHRSYYDLRPGEFMADCDCDCGCQCGRCRKLREDITPVVESTGDFVIAPVIDGEQFPAFQVEEREVWWDRTALHVCMKLVGLAPKRSIQKERK